MSHPKEEKTFMLVKPDGVSRGLIGEIIRRVEQRGLKVVALAMVQPTREKIDGHYPQKEEWITRLGTKTLATYEKHGFDPVKELGTTDALAIGQMVRGWLLDFMCSGPVVKIVIQGVHAVELVRKLCGSTMPIQADCGTIRGDYSADSPVLANKDKRTVKNLVHASETPEEANHEISYWFTKDEIYDYKRGDEDIIY